jgi:hypothetical protein
MWDRQTAEGSIPSGSFFIGYEGKEEDELNNLETIQRIQDS